MGVMPCGRRGCREILCHHRILENDDSRYICNGCFSELNEVYKGWPKGMTRPEIKDAIVVFMRTLPGFGEPLSEDEMDREFKRLTGQD